MSKNYKEIFGKIENSLMSSMKLDKAEFDKRLEGNKTLKFEERSDEWYFNELKYITFYSGVSAVMVTSKLNVINKHLPKYQDVAKYGDKEMEIMLSDKNMIKHTGKIKSVIKNANTFIELIKEYGSIHNYLVSLKPEESLENFYKATKNKFAHLGEITTFHFMMEIGLNVVKPDRVVTRIFERLGLIDDPNDLWKTVEVGRKFSEVTGLNIRYIDMVFVMYGQQSDIGICVDNPKCSLCGVYDLCKYEHKSKK